MRGQRDFLGLEKATDTCICSCVRFWGREAQGGREPHCMVLCTGNASLSLFFFLSLSLSFPPPCPPHAPSLLPSLCFHHPTSASLFSKCINGEKLFCNLQRTQNRSLLRLSLQFTSQAGKRLTNMTTKVRGKRRNVKRGTTATVSKITPTATRTATKVLKKMQVVECATPNPRKRLWKEGETTGDPEMTSPRMLTIDSLITSSLRKKRKSSDDLARLDVLRPSRVISVQGMLSLATDQSAVSAPTENDVCHVLDSAFTLGFVESQEIGGQETMASAQDEVHKGSTLKEEKCDSVQTQKTNAVQSSSGMVLPRSTGILETIFSPVFKVFGGVTSIRASTVTTQVEGEGHGATEAPTEVKPKESSESIDVWCPASLAANQSLGAAGVASPEASTKKGAAVKGKVVPEKLGNGGHTQGEKSSEIAHEGEGEKLEGELYHENDSMRSVTRQPSQQERKTGQQVGGACSSNECREGVSEKAGRAASDHGAAEKSVIDDNEEEGKGLPAEAMEEEQPMLAACEQEDKDIDHVRKDEATGVVPRKDDAAMLIVAASCATLECIDEDSDDQAGVDEEDDFDDFNPYLFIKRLPKLSEVVPECRTQLLPKQTRRSPPISLVLDLDETLVHSTLELCPDADFCFPVHINNQQHMVYVRRRPHLQAFMERVAELFEIIVFTASQSVYAEQLLNILDPQRKLIRHRVFRDSCVYVDGNYLKDLSILGRDLAKVAIIDNSPQAFGFQVDNGIPIESWFDDRSDCALQLILPFLESLVGVDDVRPVIAKQFSLREKIAATVEPARFSAKADPLLRSPP